MAADAAAALLLTRAPIDGITEMMTDADIARHAAYVVDVADPSWHEVFLSTLPVRHT